MSTMFSLLCPFVALVVSHFCFEGRTPVLFASVPGHCLPFTFSCKSCSNGTWGARWPGG